MSWTYDEADRVTTVTMPNSEILTYTYDASSGLVDTLTTNATTHDIVSNATWNALGQPLSQQWGEFSAKKFYRTWEYTDDTLRLYKIQAGTGTSGSAAGDIVKLVYDYDAIGAINWVKDVNDSNQKQCFDYDDLRRLTDAYTSDVCDGNYDGTIGTAPYDLTYDHDAVGNIDEVTDHVGSTYDALYDYEESGSTKPHAATSAGAWEYTYDANGNQETRELGTRTDTLTFDDVNRLVEYDNDDTDETARFIYDAEGTRIVKVTDVDGSSETVSHYVGGVYEYTDLPSGSDDEERTYYTFGGATVGYRYEAGTTDERRYLVSDHLGTNAAEIRYVTTLPTTVQRHFPYGQIRGASANGLDTEHTYTGQIDDGAATDLMFYNARYYDPTLRRFISADTIIPDPANPQDLNRYTYVRNNPTNANDPSGHCTMDGTLIFAGPCDGPDGLYDTWESYQKAQGAQSAAGTDPEYHSELGYEYIAYIYDLMVNRLPKDLDFEAALDTKLSKCGVFMFQCIMGNTWKRFDHVPAGWQWMKKNWGGNGAPFDPKPHFKSTSGLPKDEHYIFVPGNSDELLFFDTLGNLAAGFHSAAAGVGPDWLVLPVADATGLSGHQTPSDDLAFRMGRQLWNERGLDVTEADVIRVLHQFMAEAAEFEQFTPQVRTFDDFFGTGNP